jgi:methylmalonyl-CoA mutase N-terminal domain/subunit
VAAIERGYPQREIAEAAYRYQRQLDTGEKTLVGVNKYTEGNGPPPSLLRIDPGVEPAQLERLRRVRRERDQGRHARALQALEAAARSDDNVVPHVLEAVRAYASVQEIADTLKKVFGAYREGAVSL